MPKDLNPTIRSWSLAEIWEDFVVPVLSGDRDIMTNVYLIEQSGDPPTPETQ